MSRSVFLVKWGSTGQASKSFHRCVLVADGATQQVTPATVGKIFDWGSVVAGQVVKLQAPAKKKSFDEAAFQAGIRFKNTYTYIGTTNWTDEGIERLINLYGSHYSLIYNNCHEVAGNALRIITESSLNIFDRFSETDIAEHMHHYETREMSRDSVKDVIAMTVDLDFPIPINREQIDEKEAREERARCKVCSSST